MVDDSQTYTRSYYEAQKNVSRTSAQVIVPLVMRWVAPTSVIDLGRGVGTWLAVFSGEGVEEIHGVDGDYIQRDQLEISEDAFTSHDLIRSYACDRSYDLAVSLEVAGRLPPESAQLHVCSLTNHAPVVLFSSSVPHQPGDNDVNQQWPAYWAKLFATRGYVPIDALRSQLWEEARVGWWYKQNVMLYVDESQIGRWPELRRMSRSSASRPLPLIHPEMFEQILTWGIKQQELTWDLYKEIEKVASSS